MYRWFLMACLYASPVVAQDMPLHEIIKPGEGWRTSSAKLPVPPSQFTVDAKAKTVTSGSKTQEVPLAEPSCTTLWHNGGTLLVGDAGGKHVWAFRIDADGTLKGADKYIALRVRKGETRSEVSALCIDKSNRVYAATKEGIQVFDPTGRLCGVLVNPTREKITALMFNGNQLLAVAGTQVFTRTMLAQGVDLPE